MARRRLDAELVRRGLVATRSEAQSAVRDGLVLVSGRSASKPSTLVDAAAPVELVGEPRRFASRGGEKLEAALDRFALDVGGRDALDAGASTGGFTDCLLRRGVAHVVAVDVGYGQLAWALRTDERVTVLDRTNVRDLRPDDLPYAPGIVVADLSFISLRLAVPALAAGLVRRMPTWCCWSSRSSRSAASGWGPAASSATRMRGATRSSASPRPPRSTACRRSA